MTLHRAWMLLKSGGRLDLLANSDAIRPGIPI